MITTKELKYNLEKHRIGFVFIKHFTNNSTGEVSNILINVGFKYSNVKKRDLKKIKNNEISYVPSNEYSVNDWKQAIKEIIKSLSEFKDIKYYNVAINKTNSLIVNINTTKIKLRGLVVKKTIVTSGVFAENNSNPVVIAKKEIKKQLKIGRFRDYGVLNCESISLNGVVLINETL